jgi:hypothetical protein
MNGKSPSIGGFRGRSKITEITNSYSDSAMPGDLIGLVENKMAR